MTEHNNLSVESLISQLTQQNNSVEFETVMQVINQNYHYQPTSFRNGDLVNESGSNEGSCKIFYFAKLNSLSAEQTLACFGRYYREDVLENPNGNDHGNIRNFIRTSWQGIEFSSDALVPMK